MTMYLHSASVYVSDQAKALDWYTSVLGFEVRLNEPMGPDAAFITVAPAGSQAELAINGPHMVMDGQTAQIGGHSGVSFVVEDLTAFYEQTVARGVQWPSPPEQMPWGDVGGHFADPDGNVFYINGEA